MALRIQAYAHTDVGLQREVNEDAFDSIPEDGFYVVADGMGGHASGQVASRLAVENLRRYLTVLATQPGHEFTFPTHLGAGPPEILVSNAIQWANERIYIESLKERKLEGMGTTLVCARAFEDFMILGHVGDSRVYRFRDGELQQSTRDHSLLNHYIDEGKITTQEEIRNFKEGNIIVKALGLKDYVEPSVRVIDCVGGDLFLLCTDGLTDQVDDWIIENVLDGNRDQLQLACESLIRLANDAGGKDNCTVMILEIIDPNATQPMDEMAPIPEELDFDGMDETLPGVGGPRRTDTDPGGTAEVDEQEIDGSGARDTVPEIPVPADIYTGDEPTDPGRDAVEDGDFNFEDRVDETT